MPSAVEISVVIPVYNSAAMLERLLKRLLEVLRSLGRPFEIVFVEDGSADHSWNELQRLRNTHPELITAVQLMRNFGQHNALMCGFRHCRGRYVVTMDDDLQNPPEEIPKLLHTLEFHGYDLVYGSYGTKRHEGWRNLGTLLVRYFYQTVFKTSVATTSFRIIRRELVESIFSYSLNFTYVDGLLAWNTQRIGEMEVEHLARASGRSGYSLRRLMLLALNLFTNFSLLPLQVVSVCGLMAAVAGFGLGLFYMAQYLLANIGIPGFASIIVAVLVLGGAQLLALGIMGEYLGRLHLNVNRKPQYVVRHALTSGSDSATVRVAEIPGFQSPPPAKTSESVRGESAVRPQGEAGQ